MRRPAFHRFVAFAALGALASAALVARATSVLPLELDAIVAGAEHIVHVRCIGNAYEPDLAVGVVTVTTFDVQERAKGAGGATLVVRQAGGEQDGIVRDFHVPRFNVGDEYVLFMPASSRLGLASPVGLAQGVFAVTAQAGERMVGNGRDFAELLAHVDRSGLPPGIAARLQLDPRARARMDLADFMALVRARAGTR